MRAKHRAELRQDWVSYAGTGRNVFGGGMLTGHGRPGPIALLKPEAIDAYCGVVSDTEKRRLYEVFASGEERRIRELVDHILEADFARRRTEGDGGAKAAAADR